MWAGAADAQSNNAQSTTELSKTERMAPLFASEKALRFFNAFFLQVRLCLASYIMPIGMPMGPTTMVSATLF